jgi:ferredoxin-NADP reductase
MAMLRFARHQHKQDLVRLVVSVRSADDLYYAAELPGAETTVIYTRRNPPDSKRPPGRLTLADLPDRLDPEVVAYVCGSTGFANHATDTLLEYGLSATAIRVERFGPTGG